MGLFNDLELLRVFGGSETEIAWIASKALSGAEAKPDEPSPAEVSLVTQPVPIIATPAPANSLPSVASVVPLST